jgi:Leucine-rich repeat (LRR) protein
MKINDLHLELCKAYSIDNLNKISLTLLNLHKSRQYSVLQKIAEIISDFVIIRITDEGKGFSKFMMLYHPDRAQFHLREINRLTLQNNFDGLMEYSHILRLERIEEIAVSLNTLEDIDYAPVYDWDFETEGFSIVNDSDTSEFVRVKTKTSTKRIGYNFYDAIKIREYGDTESEFPSYYLENTDEFELSSSDINDLDGVQFCIHAKSIDLSDNRIADLSPLSALVNLEELNLSDNEISFIDDLAYLAGLKSVNLANNLIEDVDPLFELEHLGYVDLTGNKIDPGQIIKLIGSGITVDY